MSILKVGIIGFGFSGKIHTENLLKFPNVEVSAVFSKIEEKHHLLRGIPIYKDYKKLLLENDVDAVIICTPTFTHSEVASFCAERGIDIFLEKPMANTLEDCDKILQSVEKNNVKLLIGHVLRFWPTYGSIQKSITNKTLKLGDIEFIQGQRFQTFPWSKWFADQRKSGGVILDLSIHDIDYALWILGKPLSVISSAKRIQKNGMSVFGESTVKINFRRNKTAECEASWAKPKNFQFYTYTKIQGTNNLIEFDGSRIHNNDFWNIKNEFSSEDGYYNELEHFLEVCQHQAESLLVSGNEGRNAVKVCLTAIKSAEQESKEIFLDEFD